MRDNGDSSVRGLYLGVNILMGLRKSDPGDVYEIKRSRRKTGGNLGYLVFLNGAPMEGMVDSYGQAEAKIDRHQHEASLVDRPCMRCRKIFKSEGIHNRMCPRCSTIGEGLI